MKNKRRLIRISLRTLLVIVTGVGIVVAWYTHYSRMRKAAFAAIRDSGGEIRMKFGEPTILEKWFGSDVFGVVVKVDMRNGSSNDELLTHIGKLAEFRKLDLSSADIDDDGLRSISHLPLTELWLQSTEISDASAETLSMMTTLDFLQLNSTSLSDTFLRDLQPLPELQDLGLRGTNITGEAMRYLSRHPNLSELDVYHTAVDDAGVGHLTNCRSITKLGLSMTQITDAVFAHLGQLPGLTRADLSANRLVTTDAVFEFEKSHPKCEIEWYRK
jgi:hypothetical protein